MAQAVTTINEEADLLNIYDENDLFTTNAYQKDKEQDTKDKRRYHKPTTSYFYVNSASRNSTLKNIFQESTLNSTGNYYSNAALFFPYNSVDHSLPITKIQFKIRDVTDANKYVQITNVVKNNEVSKDSSLFEVYIPVDKLTNYTLGNLGQVIKDSINRILYERASSELTNSVTPDNMFSVSAHIDALLNPDRITISISCQPNYEFILSFTFDTLINENDVFPYPNNYTIYLDKIYSNVKCMRIIDSNISFSDTIINEWNNIVEFKIKNSSGVNLNTLAGSVTFRLVIEVGNYNNDISNFLSYFLLHLNTYVFSETGLSNLFSLDTYNPSNQIITLRIDPMYTFEFEFISDDKYGARNLYRMLGFSTNITDGYTSVFTNSIPVNTGKIIYYKPFSAISFYTSKIIWIDINNYECIYDSLTKKYYFNKFPINKLQTIDYEFVFSTEPHVYKLSISLYDETGVLYNTNNIDHSFTIEIVWHVDRIAGTDISSYRGIHNVETYGTPMGILKPESDNIIH